MENRNSPYEDYKVNIKLVLSGLWTSVMFLYIYGDYFELYVPNKVKDLLDGTSLLATPYKLLLASAVLAIPALMIFLSLTTKPKWNKVLNIVVGLFFTLFTLLVGFSSLTEWKIFYVMLSFLESLVTSIIVWKAWHWPKTISNPI